jgi:beta-lactamase class A
MEMGMLDRRSMIAGAALAPLAIGWPALARGETRPWTSYERETGGRFGIYAENLSSGARIAWRSNELFVMCSTFKFSLAALALARADRGVLRLDEVLSYGPAEIEDYAPIARKNLPRDVRSRDSVE